MSAEDNWGVDLNNCVSAAMKKATMLVGASPLDVASCDAACNLMNAASQLLTAGALYLGDTGAPPKRAKA